MKKIFTQARKANRGPSKTAGAAYCMSVLERRAHNILASDSNSFNEKHGAAFMDAVKNRKAEIAAAKRMNVRRTN